MEINLESVDDGMQYLAKVSVGTEDVEQILLLDTGSNQLWVTSIFCEESGQCDHNYYTTYDLKSSKLGKYKGELRHDDRAIKVLTHDVEFADQA